MMEEKADTKDDRPAVPPLRRARTTAILLSSLCWGLSLSIPGLSLLELQRQVDTSLQEITLALTARSLGHLAGSLASGFSYDRFENHFVLGSALLGAGTVSALIPWIQDYYFVLAAMVIWGLFTGYVDTGNNHLALDLWGKKAGPVLQAANMLVAAGGIIVSLVVGPFLTTTTIEQSSIRPNQTISHISPVFSNDTTEVYMHTRTSLNTTNNSSIPQENFHAESVGHDIPPLWIPYSFISGIFCLVSFVYFGLYAKLPGRIMISKNADPDFSREQHFSNTNDSFRFRMVILALIFVYLILYVGNEAIFVGFLYTFAVKCDVHLSPQIASFLTTAFWGGIVISRGFAIFLARFHHPTKMLLEDLTGCCLAAVVLAFWGKDNVIVLFIGTIMMGLSMGSAWPASVTWAERYITMNGKATGLFLVAVAFAYLFYPWIMGMLIAKYAIISMMYFLVGLCVASFLMFAVLQTVASKCSHIGQKNTGEGKVNEITVKKRELIELEGKIAVL